MIDNQSVGKVVEGSGLGLFKGIIPAFTCRD
jgi:hypothetical protein